MSIKRGDAVRISEGWNGIVTRCWSTKKGIPMCDVRNPLNSLTYEYSVHYLTKLVPEKRTEENAG